MEADIKASAKSQHAASGDKHVKSPDDTTTQLGAAQGELSAEQRGGASAGGDAGESTAAGDDAGDDGEGEQAEQRVLGALQGIDGWSEVMDMASRQVRPPRAGLWSSGGVLEGQCGWYVPNRRQLQSFNTTACT